MELWYERKKKMEKCKKGIETDAGILCWIIITLNRQRFEQWNKNDSNAAINYRIKNVLLKIHSFIYSCINCFMMNETVVSWISSLNKKYKINLFRSVIGNQLFRTINICIMYKQRHFLQISTATSKYAHSSGDPIPRHL